MPGPAIPLRAARALFLERQHLDRPRAAALTARRLQRFVEDVGGVQLDSINVVDRAHYLTLWSRFGPYDRASLDRLVYGRRVLFEYWAHAACLVPATMLPWWRRAMLDYRERHAPWRNWCSQNPGVLRQVKAAVRANGPMAAADFDGQRPRGSAGWWDWRPVQLALHYLCMTGALAVESRRHFHKRFDLLERTIPAVRDCEPVSSADFSRWHVRRSLHAMGAATEKDLKGYLTSPRFPPGARRAALRALIRSGEATEIGVEGQPGAWFALAADVSALDRAGRSRAPSEGTTLLSPFDSLLWYRERVSRLFGFHYRIEVYTPGDQRVHGYYTLPILHRGELIGRIDAKAHRSEGRLEARHAHFEPWFAAGKRPPTGEGRIDRGEALRGVADALASLAAFVGAQSVVLRRVTPQKFRQPLKRAIAAR